MRRRRVRRRVRQPGPASRPRPPVHVRRPAAPCSARACTRPSAARSPPRPSSARRPGSGARGCRGARAAVCVLDLQCAPTACDVCLDAAKTHLEFHDCAVALHRGGAAGRSSLVGAQAGAAHEPSRGRPNPGSSGGGGADATKSVGAPATDVQIVPVKEGDHCVKAGTQSSERDGVRRLCAAVRRACARASISPAARERALASAPKWSHPSSRTPPLFIAVFTAETISQQCSTVASTLKFHVHVVWRRRRGETKWCSKRGPPPTSASSRRRMADRFGWKIRRGGRLVLSEASSRGSSRNPDPVRHVHASATGEPLPSLSPLPPPVCIARLTVLLSAWAPGRANFPDTSAS